ncbi:MAG: methyltransferase [Snodgrassella sp.]|uniref:class I SAM-dependent methyltransferase n=1 Tax=Snodgrassella sp. TaxID=2815304 RepID=UPI0025828569|nr:methyltransferase [Snodgrassella sp.]MCO6507904.1 methyltransferase [Snodgrassella sp.]
MTTLPHQPDWFLHAHLAATLDERLSILRQPPAHILLAAADGNESYRLLKMRYPHARFQEFDSRDRYLQAAQAMRKAKLNWLQKFNSSLPVQTVSDQLPSNQAADMVWSNLGLIHQADPIAVINNWAGALRPDGLLFFSHFGADTLKEVLTLWRTAGIVVKTPHLLDMHDLGDMLYQHGFYDPVMDMNMLTLQYTKAERFIDDMRTAGLWQSLQFDNEIDAVRILVQAWKNNDIHNVTLELVYGHGVKKQILPDNATPIQFYPSSPTKTFKP